MPFSFSPNLKMEQKRFRVIQDKKVYFDEYWCWGEGEKEALYEHICAEVEILQQDLHRAREELNQQYQTRSICALLKEIARMTIMLQYTVDEFHGDFHLEPLSDEDIAAEYW